MAKETNAIKFAHVTWPHCATFQNEVPTCKCNILYVLPYQSTPRRASRIQHPRTKACITHHATHLGPITSPVLPPLGCQLLSAYGRRRRKMFLKTALRLEASGKTARCRDGVPSDDNVLLEPMCILVEAPVFIYSVAQSL